MSGFFGVVLASCIKKRAEYTRYWLDFIFGLAIRFVFFLGIVYAIPLEDSGQAVSRLVGFSLWYLSSHVLAKLGNIAIEEAYLGTAEQVLTTRQNPVVLLLGVGIAEVMFSALWVAGFLILSVPLIGLSVLSGIDVQMLMRIVVYGITGLVGMMGMGVLILGLSLRFKQVGAITEVVLYYLLLFSGFFIPPETFPALFRLLNSLSPLAWTVRGMNDGIGLLWIAALVSIAWVVLGATVTVHYWRWAKKAGKLGSYV